MDLNKHFSLTKQEVVITLLAFIALTSIVLSSRLISLTSGNALQFDKSTSIIFTESSGLDSLIVKLKDHEIELDEEEFQWASDLLGWRTFQRGRYEFKGTYSYNSLLSKMARGIQDPVSLVILPGITPELLSKYVGDRMHFNRVDFLNALTDSAFLAQKGYTKEQLFGRMLPETYLMYWTSSPKDVIRRILSEFENSVVEPLKGRAEELGITMAEALTMASIVEWEANLEEEKSIISGLYWNRLEKGMRLQADPTVNFAVGERRRLLFEDYQLDHAFNTYVINGLPPGPITNPSFNTIKATLYPEDHQYLYMVANPNGGHTFTRTFEEHKAESEKWRSWLQEQYRIKARQEASNNNTEGS